MDFSSRRRITILDAHVFAPTVLRATFCNHRESPDNFSFFESFIISPKIPFDELFLKTILKTSGDIYFRTL